MGDIHFVVSSIEDAITAAGLMDDDERTYLTGADLKKIVPQLIDLRDDLIKCHELCTKLGVPDLGGGVHGLRQRLEKLYEDVIKGD